MSNNDLATAVYPTQDAHEHLAARLVQMKALAPGWCGRGSAPPRPGHLAIVETMINDYADVLAVYRVAIAPTPDGNIVFECDTLAEFRTATLGADNQMTMTADDRATDSLAEGEQPFSDIVLLHFLTTGATSLAETGEHLGDIWPYASWDHEGRIQSVHTLAEAANLLDVQAARLRALHENGWSITGPYPYPDEMTEYVVLTDPNGSRGDFRDPDNQGDPS